MIRQATKYDIEQIIEMLKNYRDESPIDKLREANDRNHIVNLLLQIFAGRGVVFFAEENNEPAGMLMAIVVQSVWFPAMLELNELAYWVEKKYRGGSIGYRLLKNYCEYGEKLKAEKRIDLYTISKMVNSPDLKYDRFGFSKLEEKWIQ